MGARKVVPLGPSCVHEGPSERGDPGSQRVIEDMYRIEVDSSGPSSATSSWTSSDLDLRLPSSARTTSVASSNALSNPGLFSVAVSRGTYYMAVSWADDQLASSVPRGRPVELR